MSIYSRTTSIASDAVGLRLGRTSFQDKGSRVRVTKEDGSIVFAALHNGNGENIKKYPQGNSQAIVGNLCNKFI